MVSLLAVFIATAPRGVIVVEREQVYDPLPTAGLCGLIVTGVKAGTPNVVYWKINSESSQMASEIENELTIELFNLWVAFGFSPYYYSCDLVKWKQGKSSHFKPLRGE